MPRYRLTVEYDGAPYNGFQAQAGQPSVQAALERAITGFCGETVRIHAAGRTDSGVHASGQVVHVDLTRTWTPKTVRDAVNAHLISDAIVVLEAQIAQVGWHARFSARERRYLYRILNRRSPPALDRGKVWHMKKPLDAAAMHAAAQRLIGLHDFTTFRDAACQANSPMRTLDLARISRADEEIHLEFSARSFLHRQVRSMTGALVEVGLGKWSADDLQAALEARSWAACGPVAPACGLYLIRVSYE